LSLSGVMDETTSQCDLIIPSQHWIESLSDAEPARGIHVLLQPAMRPVPAFQARPAGDTLLALARAAALPGAWADDWTSYVKSQWKPVHARLGAGRDFDLFWTETLQQGGAWENASGAAPRWSGSPAFAAPQLRGAGDFAVVL